MRPTLLNPLFALVTSLPGVGPKQDKLLRYLLSRDETPGRLVTSANSGLSRVGRIRKPKTVSCRHARVWA